MIEAGRFHDFSAGHRVMGHESKCASLHGHNYRVHFDVRPLRAQNLDAIGRVIDFSGIKVLCEWLETNWDHKFLFFQEDSLMQRIAYETTNGGSATFRLGPEGKRARDGFVALSFNPTAENMAIYLGTQVARDILPPDVYCASVTVWETRKCYAVWRKEV